MTSTRSMSSEMHTFALCEIHEYHCGCDEPGNPQKCVAEPVGAFEVITRTDVEWAYRFGKTNGAAPAMSPERRDALSGKDSPSGTDSRSQSRRTASPVHAAYDLPQVVRDALVALWTDRRSDKHAELYAQALQTLESSASDSESPTPQLPCPECGREAFKSMARRGAWIIGECIQGHRWPLYGAEPSPTAERTPEWEQQETC